jgi:hypothetical protein
MMHKQRKPFNYMTCINFAKRAQNLPSSRHPSEVKWGMPNPITIIMSQESPTPTNFDIKPEKSLFMLDT